MVDHDRYRCAIGRRSGDIPDDRFAQQPLGADVATHPKGKISVRPFSSLATVSFLASLAASVRRSAEYRWMQLDAFGHFGPGAVDLPPHARDVGLGGCEQAAEFIVQLARQVPALFLAHALQVLRQVQVGAGRPASYATPKNVGEPKPSDSTPPT